MTIYMQTEKRPLKEAPMSDAERKARVELAAAYRIFDMLGWTEMIFNHITVRVPGPEVRFLINPFGLHYSEVTASSLVLIDIDGNPVRDTKWPVNRAGFVIHSAIHGAIPLGRVAYHEFEGVTVEPAEKERLVRDIGDKPAVILRNHGLLAWGPSVPEAFLLMWTLQRACDVQIATSRAGTVHPIRPEVFEQTVREGGPAEKRTCEDAFAALQRKLDAIDPSYR